MAVSPKPWPHEINMDLALANKYAEVQKYIAMAGMGAAVAPERYSPMQKLLMRLNMHSGESHPFHGLHVVPIPATQSVAVFFVYNNKPIVLEDGEALFPSDGLIGKLNAMR